MEPQFTSIPKAADALGIGRSKAYELIGEHKLETVRIGRRRLVTVASIRALAKDLTEASNATA